MKTIIKLIILACFFLNTAAYAEIVTDGTMGGVVADGSFTPSVYYNKPNSQSGVMSIPQEMGTTVENNLFHSFSTFNIYQGTDINNPHPGVTESVTFSGSNSLENVISRVTGSNPSMINGLLQWSGTGVGSPNFYFINPNGVTFGANAVVDVPAAFHVSTADRINAGVGVFYSATDIANSSTFSAAPESFGFLAANAPGTITFNGSQITLKPGQTLDVVAGNILVQEGINKDNLTQSAILDVTGEIRMLAKQGDGDISLQKNSAGFLSLPDPNPSFTNAGEISVKDSSLLVAKANSDVNTVQIALWGKKISFNKSTIHEFNYCGIYATLCSIKNSGNLLIKAENLDIEDNSSFINYIGGSINVDVVKSLKINQNSSISSPRGIISDSNITVNADSLEITSGGKISADSGKTSAPYGYSGNIMVTALNQLIIDGSGSGIFSEANPLKEDDQIKPNLAAGGNITVEANNLDIRNNGVISSSAKSLGKAGNISVTADKITLDNGTIKSAAETGSTGQTGKVTINDTTAGSISLLNGGKISIENNGNNGDPSTITPGDLLVNASTPHHE